MATAAAVMNTKVTQPSQLMSGGLTAAPITVRLLVKRMIRRIRGGARMPLTTADKNSIYSTETHKIQRQANSDGGADSGLKFWGSTRRRVQRSAPLRRLGESIST